MASSNPATGRQTWSSGRGFATLDPERRREVVGYVRSGSEASPASRRGASAAAKPGKSWMRVEPDPEGGYEGSSSGRWR